LYLGYETRFWWLGFFCIGASVLVIGTCLDRLAAIFYEEYLVRGHVFLRRGPVWIIPATVIGLLPASFLWERGVERVLRERAPEYFSYRRNAVGYDGRRHAIWMAAALAAFGGFLASIPTHQ
jgi:hypothetical protein